MNRAPAKLQTIPSAAAKQIFLGLSMSKKTQILKGSCGDAELELAELLPRATALVTAEVGFPKQSSKRTSALAASGDRFGWGFGACYTCTFVSALAQGIQFAIRHCA